MNQHEWSPDGSALRGRIAVVAGATRGAGRGIACGLAAALLPAGPSRTAGCAASTPARPRRLMSFEPEGVRRQLPPTTPKATNSLIFSTRQNTMHTTRGAMGHRTMNERTPWVSSPVVGRTMQQPRMLALFVSVGLLAGCKSAQCAPTKTARDEVRRGLTARPMARETQDAVQRLSTALANVKDDASDDRTWSMARDSVNRLASVISKLDEPASPERTQQILSVFQSEKGSVSANLEELGRICKED